MIKRLKNAIDILNVDCCPFSKDELKNLKAKNIYGWMMFKKKTMQKDGSELVELEYVYLKKGFSLDGIWAIEESLVEEMAEKEEYDE